MNARLSTLALAALALAAPTCGSKLVAGTDARSLAPGLFGSIDEVAKRCQAGGADQFSVCYLGQLAELEPKTLAETCYLRLVRERKTSPYSDMEPGAHEEFKACLASATPKPATGGWNIASMQDNVVSGACRPEKPADRALVRLSEGVAPAAIEDKLTSDPAWNRNLARVFLVVLADYADTCRGDAVSAGQLAAHLAEHPIEEAYLDTVSLDATGCNFLKLLARRDLWPFGPAFAAEVESGQYERAEVTRVLWIETLEKYRAGCAEWLSNRDRIAVETKVRRLRRIIGLDDPTLIEMRSQMILALKAGAHDKVLAYSKAISEREQALDGANAAEYRAKLAAIEGALAGQKSAGSGAPDPTASAASKSKNVAETAANVAATAQSVAETVETTRQILSIFGI